MAGNGRCIIPKAKRQAQINVREIRKIKGNLSVISSYFRNSEIHLAFARVKYDKRNLPLDLLVVATKNLKLAAFYHPKTDFYVFLVSFSAFQRYSVNQIVHFRALVYYCFHVVRFSKWSNMWSKNKLCVSVYCYTQGFVFRLPYPKFWGAKTDEKGRRKNGDNLIESIDSNANN